MQFNEIFQKYLKYFKTPISILFWLLIIFAFVSPAEGFMTILSAIVHEAGHYLYTLIFLRSPATPYGSLSGLRIKKSGILSYGEEIMLYLSGPIANIILCMILLPFFVASHRFAKELFVTSALTMISNLLPIEGYDGYGAIVALAAVFDAEERVRRALRGISFFFTVILVLISLYLMYFLNGGYWIFAIFSLSMLSFIKKELKIQNERFQEI